MLRQSRAHFPCIGVQKMSNTFLSSSPSCEIIVVVSVVVVLLLRKFASLAAAISLDRLKIYGCGLLVEICVERFVFLLVLFCSLLSSVLCRGRVHMWNLPLQHTIPRIVRIMGYSADGTCSHGRSLRWPMHGNSGPKYVKEINELTDNKSSVHE